MKAYGNNDYDIWEIDKKEEFEMVRKDHPDVPLTFQLKTDCLRRGVTFSRPAIEKLQDPEKYNIAVSIEFQWHQMDETSMYDIPWCFQLSDATAVGIRVSPPENDPYLIELIDDKFFLCWDEKTPIGEIFFNSSPEHYGNVLSCGLLSERVAHLTGTDTFYFVPTHHCQYANDDEQCRFCDLDYHAKHQMKMGKGFKTRQLPEDLYEATCQVLKEKGRWSHCFINSGSDPRENYAHDFQYNLDCVAAVNKAGRDVLGIDRYPLWLLMAPQSKEKMKQLYDAGVSALGSYIETWDPEHFKQVCPGKARHVGRDEYIKRTVDAVEIFGEGNVNMGFVRGVEMAPPPFGFEDVEDALASTLEGYAFLIENAVVPLGTNWAIEPGTILYQLGAKQPPLEFYVRLDKEEYKLLKKYQKTRGYGISADFACWKAQVWSCYSDYQRLL